MKNKYPRVLIISEFYFGENTGGSILLKNLFKNYPREKIFIIHEDINVNQDFLLNSFCLKSKKKFIEFIKKIIPAKLLQPLFKIIVFFSLSKNKEINIELLRRLYEFNPELIYTILGNYNLMCFIKDIKLKLDIPIVTHIMDNMLANFKNSNGKDYRIFKYFIDNSEARIAINSKMAEVFKKKFKCNFSVIHNGVDKNKIQKVNVIKATKIITYVGSVFKNAQLNSLIEISKAVEKLSTENQRIKLFFYFPENLKNLYKSYFPINNNIIIKTHNLSDKEYFRVISKSDLLILASNFDEKSIDYYKYSWPAKMGTYLMSKVPIFIYGPRNVFFVENAIENSWAHVEFSNSFVNLKKSLMNILYDNNLRKKILRNALIMSKDFKIENIRKEFNVLLSKSVKK